MRRSIFYMLLVIVVSGCSTSKKAIREPLKEQGADYLINKLKSNELKFNTLSAKFSATYYSNRKKTNISGQLRIKRDSIIWISITPMLGIEMARFMLTPDSIKYINRINSTYLLKDFKYVNQLLNKTLDFDMAQAFLTGNDFSLYENNTFRASVDNRTYKLHTINRRKLKRYVRRSEEEISIPLQTIWLDPDQFKITQVVLKEAERDSRMFSAEYAGFEKINEQYFPLSMDYRIETDKDKVRIKIDFSKILLDTDPTFQFTIPDSYTEIDNFTIK
jgi:hypothetical protein